jgi:hypothetical protein
MPVPSIGASCRLRVNGLRDEEVEPRYLSGILTITLPIAEHANPKVIKVRTFTCFPVGVKPTN